jgi:hypothetical protein
VRVVARFVGYCSVDGYMLFGPLTATVHRGIGNPVGRSTDRQEILSAAQGQELAARRQAASPSGAGASVTPYTTITAIKPVN